MEQMSGSFAQCAATADVNKMALSKADAVPVQAELDRLRDALAAEVQRAARAESEARAQLAAAAVQAARKAEASELQCEVERLDEQAKWQAREAAQ